MREFIATVRIREHSGLSALEAQDRIRRQVSGLLTGNLEVARVDVRPKEMDLCLEVMSDILDRIERAEHSAKASADQATLAAIKSDTAARSAERAAENTKTEVDRIGGGCPFKNLKGA